MFMCHTPRQISWPTMCPSWMPTLWMRDGGRLPGALGLDPQTHCQQESCRIRTQSFIGVAMSQTPETTQGFLVLGFCPLCPKVGPPNE